MKNCFPTLPQCLQLHLRPYTMAVPSHAAEVSVNDEAGLRAAFANSAVSEIVVTADVNLTSGHLRVPPGRVLSVRGACGGAVQVHPGHPMVFAVDSTLASRHFQLLKLKHDKPLSNSGFNCKVRHYYTAPAARRPARWTPTPCPATSTSRPVGSCKGGAGSPRVDST